MLPSPVITTTRRLRPKGNRRSSRICFTQRYAKHHLSLVVSDRVQKVIKPVGCFSDDDIQRTKPLRLWLAFGTVRAVSLNGSLGKTTVLLLLDQTTILLTLRLDYPLRTYRSQDNSKKVTLPTRPY